MLIRTCIVSAAIFLLTGCATAYGPSNGKSGYSDTQLQQDIFRVSFSGNAKTSKERAGDFAMLRASEVTLANKYTYFAIIDNSDTSSTSFVTMPVGNNLMTNAVEFPRSTMLIKCFTNKPETIMSYDANFLMGSIKKKYEMQ